MLSTIYFNLDQSKILSFGNGLISENGKNGDHYHTFPLPTVYSSLKRLHSIIYIARINFLTKNTVNPFPNKPWSLRA